MYSIGFYIHKFPQSYISLRKKVCIYLGSTILLFLVSEIINKNYSRLLGWVFSYANPLVIIGSVSLFLIFMDFNITSIKLIKFIKITANSTLAVYLLTDHIEVQRHIYDPILFFSQKLSNDNYFLVVVVYSLLLYICCLVIDIIRKRFLGKNI